MLDKLFVSEEETDAGIGWSVSYDKPEFQGGESIDIDKQTAKQLMSLIRYE